MNPQHFFAPQSMSSKIQEFFYNSVVDKVLESGKYTRETLPVTICHEIQVIIKSILKNSKDCRGIKLGSELEITEKNCPETYRSFYNTLMQYKKSKPNDAQLGMMAQQIMQLDSFKERNPALFLLELAGLSTVVQSNVQYDENGVTAQLIRDTFYNEMVTQQLFAVSEGILSKEDIEDQESHIYTALPCLTLIEALSQSKNCVGIRLLNNKMLTEQNTPENFRDFTKAILQLKPAINKLSPEEIRFIKFKLAGDVKVPANLAQFENSKLMEQFGAVKGVAIDISRSHLFKEMVGTVLAYCSKTLSM